MGYDFILQFHSINNTFRLPKEDVPEKAVVDDGEWTHCKLEFLKPDKIRDAMQRRPDHPDYDPTTLYVPPKFMKEQTPVRFKSVVFSLSVHNGNS